MKTIRLGNNAVVTVGHPFQSKKFCEDQGIRLLRGVNVKRGLLDWSQSITKCWPEADSTLVAFELHDGDIIVAMDGALVGKSCCRVAPSDLPAYLVQRVARIRCGPLLDQSYLYHFVASAVFDKHIGRRKTHTAIPHITKRDIEDFQLPFYAPADQRRIGIALDRVDLSGNLLAALYAARQKQRAGLANTLLTGELRIPTFDAGTAGDREPPPGWRRYRLEDVADVRFSSVDKISRPEEIGVRLCNYMDVWRNKYIDDNTVHDRGTATAREVSQFSLQAGDVLLTKDSETREDIGAAACVRTIGADVVLGYHLALVRPKSGMAVGGFLAKQLALERFRRQFVRAASGATRYGLSIRTVRQAEVWLPSVEEQEAVSRLLECIDNQLALLADERRALQTLKRAVVASVTTGRPSLPKFIVATGKDDA